MYPEYPVHNGDGPVETPAAADFSPAPFIPQQARVQELESENRRLLNLVGELLMTNQRLREQYSKISV